MKKSSKPSKKNKETDDPLAGDLSHFIREGNWHAAQFELTEKKDKVISLRLSEKLLRELKKQAASMGIDTQKFIRMALESTIRKKAG